MKNPLSRGLIIIASLLAIAALVYGGLVLPEVLGGDLDSNVVIAVAIVFAAVFYKFTDVLVHWLQRRLELRRQVKDLQKDLDALRQASRFVGGV